MTLGGYPTLPPNTPSYKGAPPRTATGAVRDADKSRPDLVHLPFIEAIEHHARHAVRLEALTHEVATSLQFITETLENADEYTLRDLNNNVRSGALDATVALLHHAHNDNVADAVLALGHVMAIGAEKYGEDNWRKGLDNLRAVQSAHRHFWMWRAGATDEDHAGAFYFNMMVVWYNANNQDHDLPY